MKQLPEHGRSNPRFNKAVQLWNNLADSKSSSTFSADLSFRKKLMQFLQIGNHFYLVFNTANTSYDEVSIGVEDVLGYNREEITPEFFFSKLHPEDQVWLVNFENESIRVICSMPPERQLNYKISYDFRIRRKDGIYVRLLHQILILQLGVDGRVLKTLCFDTDITHLKPTGKPCLSFIGLEGEPSYINVPLHKPLIPFQDTLSKREREILQLLIEGNSNKQIAELLFLSKQTVDTHRKNMLEKTNSRNSIDLIATAIREGWV